MASGIWLSAQGSNSGCLHWEHGVLATEPPGKSLFCAFGDETDGIKDPPPSFGIDVTCFDCLGHLREVCVISRMEGRAGKDSALHSGGGPSAGLGYVTGLTLATSVRETAKTYRTAVTVTVKAEIR